MELKNSTILITGGTSGIGLELVKQLTDRGACVIITGRKEARLRDVKKRFPHVHTFQSDVSKPNDVEKLYDQVTYRFPTLNIIYNNAGEMRLMDLQDSWLQLENITREIDTNLKGTIHIVHKFLPHLLSKGEAAIVNVSSAIAFLTYSSAPIYSASKAGLHAYTKALRLQLEKSNVKVFEIFPPGVNTNLQNDWLIAPEPSQMMEVDKLVRVVVKGLEYNQLEIKPGLARVIKIVSRLAPDFFLRFGHREFERFKALNSIK